MVRQTVEECGSTIAKTFDLDDLEVTQRTSFPEFQLRVISTRNGDSPIAQFFEKTTAGTWEIHLSHDHDHYDLITSMAGFHMAVYYCSACGKPYDHKEQPKCGAICRLCYRFNEECLTFDAPPCQDCGRTFQNLQCSAIHKQVRHNGTTYCEQLFICETAVCSSAC